MIDQKIPKSWEWVNIFEISNRVGGGTPSRKNMKYFAGECPWITVADIPKVQWDIFELSNSRESITTKAIQDSSTNLIPSGSVILATRVSVGKIGINSTDLCTNQDFSSFTEISINNKFLAFYLLFIRNFLIRKSTGTTIKGINLKVIEQIYVPIPPLKEQKRIVQKIESCFEKIDSAQKNLEQVKILLEKYRSSLLAKAFRGELVEQNKSDEPASVLLEKIRKEREENQKSKKKKQEFKSIAEDEKPFKIPDSWAFTSVGKVITLKNGFAFKSKNFQEEGIHVIRISNVKGGQIDLKEGKKS